MVRLILFMVITAVATSVYLGLAIHVISRNPRWALSWVFAGFCATIVSYLLTSLFLFPGTGLDTSAIPFPLRWKWAAGSFSATFYLHLAAYYFPASWRRGRRWLLIPAYVLSAGFGLAALFTDLLVAGPLYRPLPNIIGPLPGPWMKPFAAFFILEIILGTAGIVTSYRTTLSPSFRRQTLYLLAPTGLALVAVGLNWTIVLTRDTGQIPLEISNLLLIGAGLLYAGAVVRYGSFVGQPMAHSRLFYSLLAAISSLVAFYLTITIDRWLAPYTLFPYPVVTGGLVVVIAVTFPVISPWIRTRLDKLLFRTEHQRRELAYHLAEALAETPDPLQLQIELLGTLCAVLNVRGGYVALPAAGIPPDRLLVRVSQGNIPVKPGAQVPRPPLSDQPVELVSSLLLHQQAEPAWPQIGLFCRLTDSHGREGVLALGEKRKGTAFTNQDLALGYLAQGRRDLAQRQVVRWRQALAEVELPPTAEIRALWEKVEQNAEGGSRRLEFGENS